MTAQPSPGRPVHRAVSGDIQLRAQLAGLLDECRVRVARREALLAPHLDADGHVVEDHAAYDDARITTAIEAANWLDSLTARLEQLVAEPPRSVYTLVFGPLGQAPDSFTLHGADEDDALNTLRQLLSFLHWSRNQAQAGPPSTSTVLEFHGKWTHPHLSAPGHRYDLRAEPAAAATRPAAHRALAPTSERPVVPPAAGTTPTRRR
ncbi:MAG: hypothetical protein FWE15_06750 [Actinomycetia bacterium]|nr:hypothetical protein [Actinomycetes bacterium]